MGNPATADPCTVIAPQLLGHSLATILGAINGLLNTVSYSLADLGLLDEECTLNFSEILWTMVQPQNTS